MFAGYLAFDATLIAHVDRHDRNWAVLVRPPETDGDDALCASVDHAASLGFTLSEEERAMHLRDGTVGRWARRGKARRFEHQAGTPWQTLVDIAGSAVRLCPASTREYWFGQSLVGGSRFSGGDYRRRANLSERLGGSVQTRDDQSEEVARCPQLSYSSSAPDVGRQTRRFAVAWRNRSRDRIAPAGVLDYEATVGRHLGQGPGYERVSLGARFGAVKLVFQAGHLSRLLGFDSVGALDLWMRSSS